MRRYYLDTSAYLAILLGEDPGIELARETQNATLCSSVLLVLEATRSLIHLSRHGTLDPADLHRCLTRLAADVQQMTLRDLTVDLCAGTEFPVVSTPRSLDLAHLRTALWFHRREPLSRFVSVDQDQNRSARELGLPV